MRNTSPRSVEPWPKIARYLRTPCLSRPSTSASDRVVSTCFTIAPFSSAGASPPQSRMARARSRICLRSSVSAGRVSMRSRLLTGRLVTSAPGTHRVQSDDQRRQPEKKHGRDRRIENRQFVLRHDHRRARLAFENRTKNQSQNDGRDRNADLHEDIADKSDNHHHADIEQSVADCE